MPNAALLPGYLVVGADEFKRSKVIAKMKARLEASGMADFNLDERDMTKDPQVDDIVASLNTLPMGAEFRLVILEGCDKLNKAISEPLAAYFDNPSPTTVCLVVAEKLPKSAKLYKAVAKLDAKAVIDCTPKKAWEMPKQVVGMAKAHGAVITLRAAEELVSRAGENSRMLDNELKKLIEMVGTSIDLPDIEKHVARTAEAKPWDLLNAVSARKMDQALQLLSLQPDKSEVRLYVLLVGRLRELIMAKALDARGQGRELAARLGVQGWQVKNHLAWARNYSMDELLQALSRAEELELALKGSRDSALALRMWLVELMRR